MIVFLDTSSLFILYYQEVDSFIIESVFADYKVTTVFLSEISKVEFAATVWKKVRRQDITELQAKVVIEAFEEDYAKYSFVQIDNIVIERAKSLITKYGREGLRSLDSIQLSTAVILNSKVNLFFSADKLLESFFELESLPIEKPTR